MPNTVGRHHDFTATRTAILVSQRARSCLAAYVCQIVSIGSCQTANIRSKIYNNGIHQYRLDRRQQIHDNDDNKLYLNFKDCEDVDDVLQLALKNIKQLRPNHIAATWSSLSRTILRFQSHGTKFNKQGINKEKINRYEKQIREILDTTMGSLNTMKPKEMTTVTLALAKMVKNIRSTPQKKRTAAQQAFSKVLSDESLSLNESIFYELAKTSKQQ